MKTHPKYYLRNSVSAFRGMSRRVGAPSNSCKQGVGGLKIPYAGPHRGGTPLNESMVPKRPYLLIRSSDGDVLAWVDLLRGFQARGGGMLASPVS